MPSELLLAKFSHNYSAKKINDQFRIEETRCGFKGSWRQRNHLARSDHLTAGWIDDPDASEYEEA